MSLADQFPEITTRNAPLAPFTHLKIGGPAEFLVQPRNLDELNAVLKAYQQLADEGLVVARRGRGMFINPGGREQLLQGERQKFLAEEWPRIVQTMKRLGLNPEDLLKADEEKA